MSARQGEGPFWEIHPRSPMRLIPGLICLNVRAARKLGHPFVIPMGCSWIEETENNGDSHE